MTQKQRQKRKVNQNTTNNRSALMLAGQNSLMINNIQDNNFKPQQSNVISIYKRQELNNIKYPQEDENYHMRSRKVNENEIFNKSKYQNTKNLKNSQLSTPYYLDINSNLKTNEIYDKKYNNKNNLDKIDAKSRYYTENEQNYKENYKNYDKNQRIQQQFNTKKIMMKLTLPRLRKIQALVRGFLVRRKIYPKVLEEYTIADSVLRLIQANVIYKQSSSILLETITFPKYEGGLRDFIGNEQMLENILYDRIIQRVIQKQLPQIVQESIIQKGVLISRPQITFGLNLRSPIQLLLYEKLMTQINYQLKLICEESIKQEAAQKRELLIIDDWIVRYDMLNALYKEIVDQCLSQNVGEYVVQSILQRINRQACYVVSQNTYNKAVLDWYNQELDILTEQVQQLLFEELISAVFIQNIQKNDQKSDILND